MESVKVCNKCHRELQRTKEFFYANNRVKDGLSGTCKECQGHRFGSNLCADREDSWTEREVNALKSLYPSEDWADILKEIPGRSWDAIKNKAYNLNVHRPKNLQTSLDLKKTTTRKCTNCGIKKPLDEFHKCAGIALGIQHVCKECRSALNQTEESRAKEREYYQSNVERIRAIDAARYYRDKEKRTAQNNARRKKRGRREEVNKRRAKIRNLTREFTKADWNNCLDAFDGSCCYCGSKDKIQQEHFIPLTKGGTYTVDNILPACKECNNSKNNKDYKDWYPLQTFYDIGRERNILQYLNRRTVGNNEIQLQASL